VVSGTHVSVDRPIRLAAPDIDDVDVAAVAAVLRSGHLVQGAQVRAFEAEVARVAGVDHAVAVANCTAALHVALLALGIAPGDRVVVPAYSWLSTANVVVLAGAEPVFVDIEPRTYGMAPGALEQVLRRTPNIRAILPVHVFGAMADIGALTALAAAHGVPVIEDAACALGATREGLPAGAWGDISCFSFHPRKAVTTGEGGVLTTDDVALATRARVLRNHGLDPTAPAPDFIAAGYNLRLTEFQAALGVTQMAKLDRIVESRRAQAARYTALFAGTPIATPIEIDGAHHVYQTYAVLLPAECASRRASMIETLRGMGVETTIGTYHMPLTTYFRTRFNFAPGDFPVTDDIAGRAVALPLHTQLGPDDQARVAASLLRLL
jgi:dTDP-4-amino-4,6-dideoxygalactose transaminase